MNRRCEVDPVGTVGVYAIERKVQTMPLNNHHDAKNASGEPKLVSASREIPASAADIFDLLSNPQRHGETDANGQVLSADRGDRLKKVGDTFRMNMTNDNGDDYQTDNVVYAFAEGRAIGWQNVKNVTKDVEVKSKWLYELEPIDASSTKVTLTYDPSEIDNPAVKQVAAQYDESKLEASLAGLADALA